MNWILTLLDLTLLDFQTMIFGKSTVPENIWNWVEKLFGVENKW